MRARKIFMQFLAPLVAASLVATASVAAKENALDFKGFIFGKTTLSEWRNATHRTDLGKTITIAPYCEEEGRYSDKAETALGIKRCSWYTPATLSIFAVGQAATKTDEWVFLDGVLTEFHATMYPAQLPNLLPALRAKYGEPTAVQTATVQNAFGAAFTNDIYVWQIGSMEIIARKYWGRLDTAGITMRNPALSDQ